MITKLISSKSIIAKIIADLDLKKMKLKSQTSSSGWPKEWKKLVQLHN